MKRKLIQSVLSVLVFLVISHYFACAWLAIEEKTLNYIEQQRLSFVASVAQAEGFVRPTENTYEPELSLDDIIERECLRKKINPALVRAMIKRESSGNPLAVSKAGAIGLMQVMPENAAFCRLSVSDLFDQRKNVICGIAILDQALDIKQGNIVNALMYYNGGNKCFDRCKETKEYPHHVLNFMATDIRG